MKGFLWGYQWGGLDSESLPVTTALSEALHGRHALVKYWFCCFVRPVLRFARSRRLRHCQGREEWRRWTQRGRPLLGDGNGGFVSLVAPLGRGPERSIQRREQRCMEWALMKLMERWVWRGGRLSAPSSGRHVKLKSLTLALWGVLASFFFTLTPRSLPPLPTLRPPSSFFLLTPGPGTVAPPLPSRLFLLPLSSRVFTISHKSTRRLRKSTAFMTIAEAFQNRFVALKCIVSWK